MCTGKRQTHIRNVPSSRTVVTGIAPYEAFSKNVRNSEMLQVSREKSRKTEGVFSGRFKGAPGENRNPPGLVFFLSLFLLEKQKKK